MASSRKISVFRCDFLVEAGIGMAVDGGLAWAFL